MLEVHRGSVLAAPGGTPVAMRCLAARWAPAIPALLATLALAAPAVAETVAPGDAVPADSAATIETIEPDRPGFTIGPTVVAPGVVELEGGISYRSAGVEGDYRLPELLIRFGAIRRVEVRVGVPDYQRVDISGNTNHRLGTASLGFKLQGGPEGSPNGVALVSALTLPVDPEDERRIAPDVAVAWKTDLPDLESFGGTLGYAWRSGAGRGPDLLNGSLAVTRPINDKIGTFIEWQFELPRGRGWGGTQFFRHGYTWPLPGRLQMDAHGALGLTLAAPDFEVGAGISIQP